MTNTWKVFSFIFGGVVLALCSIFFLTILSQKTKPSTPRQNPVVATIYPLQYITARLLTGVTTVTSVVPQGVEPHDFEPRPQDVTRILEAPLVVGNGAHVDTWVTALASDIQRGGGVLVVLEHEIDFLKSEHHDEEEGESAHEDTLLDPHVWLDPVRMEKAAQVLRDKAITIFPKSEGVIFENFTQLQHDLQNLDTAYRVGLASCDLRTAIVSHNAFSYIGHRYNITFEALAGISPEEEPNPKRLAEVAAFAKKNNISTIFFETLVSPKVAEVVAKEVGITTSVLNPIEGLTEAEQKNEEDYLSLMMENLYALKKALVCQ